MVAVSNERWNEVASDTEAIFASLELRVRRTGHTSARLSAATTTRRGRGEGHETVVEATTAQGGGNGGMGLRRVAAAAE